MLHYLHISLPVRVCASLVSRAHVRANANMRKAPNVYPLARLLNDTANPECQVEIGGRWLPARPEGYFSLQSRVRAAWLVFTGRADAVIWPGNQ